MYHYEIKAQRDEVTCQSSHNSKVMELEFKPKPVPLNMTTLFTASCSDSAGSYQEKVTLEMGLRG